ncbi:MAG: hypothetical protein A2104_03465 [Candidatus Melainabacteria bacterium GWF2_32_7]|nr:MAG: hypothetical protein A2104_03465 [Candidatus Melainabacteria bacterium GWF2_32_7]
MTELIPEQIIENKIFVIYGLKVMLDSDIAQLYGVETKVLNQAVKRNIGRFPKDFMFQLTNEDFSNLKSQIVTSSWGGKRKLPYAFTEYGVLMLSSVLNSEKAVQVNIQIIRVFAKLKEMALTHTELSKQLKELETRFIVYAKETNTDIEEIFRQLNFLTKITKPEKYEKIGFKTER